MDHGTSVGDSIRHYGLLVRNCGTGTVPSVFKHRDWPLPRRIPGLKRETWGTQLFLQDVFHLVRCILVR